MKFNLHPELIGEILNIRNIKTKLAHTPNILPGINLPIFACCLLLLSKSIVVNNAVIHTIEDNTDV